MPVISSVSSHSTRVGSRRLILRWVRKNSAHAASPGGAERKYAALAATFAFVEVVRSSSSYSRANAFIIQTRREIASLHIRLAFPRSSEHARGPPALAEEPRQLLRVAVGDEHAPGPRVLDRAEERRPVRVVGEDEAAVVSLAPARAAHAHPARGECYLPLPEAP